MNRTLLATIALLLAACSQDPNLIRDEPRDCGECGDAAFARDEGVSGADTRLNDDMGTGRPDSSNNPNNTNNLPEECQDPGDTARFAVWSNGITANVSHDRTFRTAGQTISTGVGIFDIDGDGDNDVIVTSQGSELTYLVNDGSGNFSDGTDAAGLSGLTETTSVSGADVDGDGDTDLLIGRTTGSYLLINDGGTFTEEAQSRGVYDPNDVVSGAAFADFDGDGDLDVYITNYHPELDPMVTLFPKLPNRMLRNDGGGFFTELAVSPSGVGAEGMTLASTWWDWDDDGLPDLWVADDFGVVHGPNKLYRNLGADPDDPDRWLFEDIAAQAGLDVKVFSMSATLADFDNDGDQDGYVANMANNVLHVRDGETTTNQSVARGVAAGTTDDSEAVAMGEPSYNAVIEGMDEFFANHADPSSGLHTLTSWTSIFFDADQDGWQDLFVANGPVLTELTPEARKQPNSFFINDGSASFTQAPCWFLPDDKGGTRGAAVGDLDGDGDLDLVWSNNGDAGQGGVHVARNDFASGNWLIVELEGAAPNTDAIGAKVMLSVDGATQTRWIDGGQGFMSVSERIAHFGLGQADTVESLEIEWPDGATQTVVVDAVNQRLVVSE